jgi:hypothetical protein
MNQYDPNQAPQQQPAPPQVQQPAPTQPMPQQEQPPNQPGQFEMPPPNTFPGGGQDFQGMGMEPQQNNSKRTIILIIVLVIILLLGGVFFADWSGWISWKPLDKLLGKTSTPVTTPTTTAVTNDDTRKADLANIKDALKKYYQANQKYPIATASDKTSEATSALNVLRPDYLTALPVDPVATRYYGYTSDGKTFTLTAVLDDTSDPSGIKAGNYYLYKVTDSSTETPTSSGASSTTGTTSSTGTTDTTGTTK